MAEPQQIICELACVAGLECIEGPVCPLAFVPHELASLDAYDEAQDRLSYAAASLTSSESSSS